MRGRYDYCSERILDLTCLTTRESLLLNQIAAEIRRPYNDLIARITSQYIGNIAWLLSSVASRHTDLSSTFSYCCQLALVRRIIETEGAISEVVTDSEGMGVVLHRFFKDNGIQTRVRFSLPFLKRLKRLIRPQWLLITSLLQFVAPFILSKVIKRERDYDFSYPITLLDCFVMANSFTRGSHVYNDRYYPGFLDVLTPDEKAFIFFLPAFVGIKNYGNTLKKIRSAPNRFLLKEDFLKFKDYLFAFFFVIQLPSLTKKLKEETTLFQGFVLLPLMIEEVRQTWSHFSITLAILNYRLAMRLRERNVPIRIVVDWNENQVIDKGLIKGIHDFYPGTPVVGYQGFIVSPLFHIYLHPTEFEVSIGVVPDEIAVIGQGLVERTKEFCPTLTVSVAPAARFEEVWRRPLVSQSADERYILLSLPIALKESVEILNLVAKAMQSHSLTHDLVMVKQHPIYTEEQVRRWCGDNWPSSFRFGSSGFHDCLDRASLLIGNTSSTCVEALARGVPVVVIGSQSGLTQNPIPYEIKGDIWKLCHTVEEVVEAILEYKARTPEKIKEHNHLGMEIRKKYFEPLTRESIRKFLRLPV